MLNTSIKLHDRCEVPVHFDWAQKKQIYYLNGLSEVWEVFYP